MNQKTGPTKESKKVTLADVAKLANVSPMTVSKVIRNTGSISAETQKRIRAAIDQLGYVPNRLAGSLSSQFSALVSVIIPSIGDIIFAEVLSGINKTLRSRGLCTVIGASEFEIASEDELVRTMLAWRPAGVILTGGVEHSPTVRRLLQSQTCPVIQIWDIDVPAFDVSVGISHVEAGRLAAEHFLRKNLRNIAYVGAELGKDLCAKRRFESFKKHLANNGVTVTPEIYADAPRQAATAIEATEALFKRQPDIDAVYYLNDAMALGGMAYFHEAGVPVPDQVAVAGFNGSSLDRSVITSLTTVNVARYRIGEIAAQSLLDQLDGEKGSAVIDVGLEFVQGNTT